MLWFFFLLWEVLSLHFCPVGVIKHELLLNTWDYTPQQTNGIKQYNNKNAQSLSTAPEHSFSPHPDQQFLQIKYSPVPWNMKLYMQDKIKLWLKPNLQCCKTKVSSSLTEAVASLSQVFLFPSSPVRHLHCFPVKNKPLHAAWGHSVNLQHLEAWFNLQTIRWDWRTFFSEAPLSTCCWMTSFCICRSLNFNISSL